MSRNLAALVAGFGTGYLAQSQREEEKKRQAERDKRDQTIFDQSQEDRAAQKEIERQLAEAGGIDESGGMGSKVEPVNIQAQPDQQSRMPNIDYTGQGNAAQEGIKLPNTNPLATEQQPQAQPVYKIMENKARVYLSSGKAEHQKAAVEMLQQAQVMKSKDYQERIMTARQSGLQGLLELANNHPGDELPYTDLQVIKSQDPNKAILTGLNEATGKPFTQEYDLRKGSIEDQLTQQLMGMTDPKNMLDYIIAQQVRDDKLREEDRANKKDERDAKVTDAQLDKYRQDIAKGNIELASLPESIRLQLQATKANIAQSNAATAASQASTKKTNNEIKQGTTKNLPSSVQEAQWYASATPELKSAFDRLQDKGAKIQFNDEGLPVINDGGDIFSVDESGKKTYYNRKKGKQADSGAVRKPLSSFDK